MAVDVLVVGAGPVGLTLALGLTRAGVACRVVDRAPAPTTLSKATTVHARTLEQLADLGVADAVLALATRTHAVDVWTQRGGHRIARFDWDDLDTAYPFMCQLPQSEMERVLTEALVAAGGRVERGVSLAGLTQDGAGVTVELTSDGGAAEQVTVPYVVGCDGAHSTTRHALGLGFGGHTFSGDFALADVRLLWDLPHDELHVFVHPLGGVFAIPLPNGRHRLVVHASGDRGDRAPTLEDMQAYLDARAPEGTRVVEPAWLATFRVNVRQAEHHAVGRVFLAGDAAHIHSPVGGQGMNTGIQDAVNLSWKLGLVLAGRAPERLLDTYEAERAPVAAGVLRDTERLTKVLTTSSPVAQSLRDHVAPLITGRHAVSHQVAAQDSQLVVSYRRTGDVVDVGHHASHAPRAGDRLPDVAGLRPAGGSEPVRLHELLRDPACDLLLVAAPGHDPEPLTALADAVRDRYAGAVRPIVLGPEPAGVVDGDGAAAHRLGVHSTMALLVRPDGYLGVRHAPADPAGVLASLDRLLVPVADVTAPAPRTAPGAAATLP